MKVLTKGHQYQLDSFEGTNPQFIQFIHKVFRANGPEGDPGLPRSWQMKTLFDGTTNEEVIRVLLDRITLLNEHMPHQFNKDALYHLTIALEFLEARTKERTERGVEGTVSA